MAAIPLPGAWAADWACRTGYPNNPAQCGYGFGPLCQPHRYCVDPQWPTCSLMSLGPSTAVCSGSPELSLCDELDNAVGAVPEGVLCCATDADCPAAPAYGQPSVSCGTPACNNGYCVQRAPATVQQADAVGQPCCRTTEDCKTTAQCTAAYCGADYHCHTQPIPGCCAAPGAQPGIPCPGSQFCMTTPGNPAGLCSSPCTTDAECDLGDCLLRVCGPKHVCQLATDGTGKPLGTKPNCCRTDADCNPSGAGRHCTNNVCVNPPLGSCTNPAQCDDLDVQRPVCAACVGDCASCLDGGGGSDKCPNCKVEACKSTGSQCVRSYLQVPLSCRDVGTDNCALTDPTQFCDITTGTCALVSCDDHNPCTGDLRLPDNTCAHTLNPSAPCDDHDPCTTGDICDGLLCKGYTAACNDNNPATTDRCNGQSGYAVCSYFAVCDDGNPCTSDVWNGTSCSNPVAQDGTVCDDGLACTVGEVCQGGVCSGIDKLFHKGFDHLYTPCTGPTGHATDRGNAVAVGINGFLGVGQTTWNSKTKGWMVGASFTGDEICRLGVGAQQDVSPCTAQAQDAWSSATGVVVTPPASPTACNGGPCNHAGQFAVVGSDKPAGYPMGKRGFLQFAAVSPAGSAPPPEQAYSACQVFGGEIPFEVRLGTPPTATSGDEELNGIAVLGQSFILAGYSKTTHSSGMPWIVQANLDGGQLWSHLDGPSAANVNATGEGDSNDVGAAAKGVAVNALGKVILVGSKTVNGSTRWWMGGFDPQGAPAGKRLWSLTAIPPYDTTQSELFGVTARPDGSVVAVGYYAQPDGNPLLAGPDLFMVAVDPNGVVLGQVVYADKDTAIHGRAAVSFSDGSFALVGANMDGYGGSVTRLDATGNKVWSGVYPKGGTDGGYFFGAQALGVSNLAIAGTVSSGGTDNMLLKVLDVGGNEGCQASLGCYGLPVQSSPAANPCFDYVCTNGLWTLVPNKDACDLPGPDQCLYGQCSNGTCQKLAKPLGGWWAKDFDAPCDDGNPCSADSRCDGAGTCSGKPGTYTQVGDRCVTTDDTCGAGLCVAAGPAGETTCQYAPAGSACDIGVCSEPGSGNCNANHRCVGAVEEVNSGTPCGANSMCGGARCMVHPN